MKEAVLSNTINSLEKKLRKANNELENIQGLNNTLSSIYESLAEIEHSVEDEELNQVFDRKIKEKQLVEMVNKVSANLNDLKQVLAQKETQDLQLREFIESYRDSRIYNFNSESTALEFLRQAFDYPTANIKFRPQFLGTIDLNEISSQLKLKKDSPNSLTVQKNKMDKLIKHLVKTKTPGHYHFESATTKATWKNPNTIHIHSSNQKIKSLDRVCRMLNGTF